MKKHQLTSVLALGISALLVHEARGQIFRIDMDYSSPATIDTVISPLLGPISVGLWLDLTGGGPGYPPGMSIYGVSLAFDNVELTLMGAPAATQSIPTLSVAPFLFITGGVLTELEVDLAYDPTGTWGSIQSFLGDSAAGPVNGMHLLGYVNFMVDSISDDGKLDVIPFFNLAAGFDGLYDNAFTAIAMPPANFVGGSVVPEPSVGLLVGSVLLLWSAGRLFRRQAKD